MPTTTEFRPLFAPNTLPLRKHVGRWRIVPKRDFGSGGFLVGGTFVKAGFVATNGGCNVMPGASWFTTIADAVRGIRIYAECAEAGLSSDEWHARVRAGK